MSTPLQARQRPITAPIFRDRVAAQAAPPRSRARQQPAAAVDDRPVGAPPAGWRWMLRHIMATLREWRRRTAARRELANFDARMLRDIGIDPGMVDYEMRQSFWRPLRDWRG